MKIVKYTHTDRAGSETLLLSLSHLENACFADPWSKGMLKGALDDKNMLLFTAEEDGEILSYLMLLVIPPEGEILNLATSPEKRRMGLGECLMRECDLFCEEIGVDRLFLEVRVSNTPAVSLYQKQGFTAVGKRKNYYHHPREDALVMVKYLKDENVSLL